MKQSQDNTDKQEIASLRYRSTRNDSISDTGNDNEAKRQPNYGKLHRASSMALSLETESLDAILSRTCINR